jgi:hypothetical protein
VPKAGVGILGDFLHWLAGASTEFDTQVLHHVLDKKSKGAPNLQIPKRFEQSRVSSPHRRY